MDEWAQVQLLQILTRYARTQFLDPNARDLKEAAKEKAKEEKEGEKKEGEEDENEGEKEKDKEEETDMEPDLRRLLDQVGLLFFSTSPAVRFFSSSPLS